jgi:hypothetical protein
MGHYLVKFRDYTAGIFPTLDEAVEFIKPLNWDPNVVVIERWVGSKLEARYASVVSKVDGG